MNKKDYVIQRFYMGNFDGFLNVVNKRHEYTYQKQYAMLFTQKQASKIVFDLNNEMKRNYSYYYRFGYYPANEIQ